MTLHELYTFCQGDIIHLRDGEKTPRDTAWTVTASGVTAEQAEAHIALGSNLGYRIADNILVIDVDPRNGGEASFDALPAKIQKLPRTTVTASGGFHIYTQLPKGFDCTRLRTKVEPEYKGIDFLHKGKQVVLPGSSLNGGKLSWTLHPKAVLPLPETPQSLIDILDRGEVDTSAPSKLTGYLSDDELYKVLANIPTSDFADNDTWLSMAMACHHATNGHGLEPFLQWSLSDPEYSDQEEMIKKRWDSFKSDRPGEASVTIRTLVKAVGKYEGGAPSWLLFRAGLTDNNENFFQKAADNKVEDEFERLQGRIGEESSNVKLMTIIAAEVASASEISDSMRDVLYKQIAKKTGAGAQTLKNDMKAVKKKTTFETTVNLQPANSGDVGDFCEEVDSSQLHLQLANATIAQLMLSCHNVTPMYTMHQWWMWNGQYWDGKKAEASIKQLILDVVKKQGVMVTASTIVQVLELIRIRLEVDADTLQGDPHGIRLYTPKTVLSFNRETAKWTEEKHSHGYRNTTIMPTLFNINAEEPTTWLSFLDQAMTSPHAQRTLACAIIYSASGCWPWLRKAFYLYGPKRSGKSTVLTLIEDFLGRDNCSALNVSQIGSRNGSAELVGKLANIANETVSKKTIEDDVFKALVSGETVMVEKKFKDPMPYRNTAKLFFGANGFPRVSDESEAVWDRLTILSFPNSCPEDKADHDLGRKIDKERSGILNWALKIFREEYAKDECRSIMALDPHGEKVMVEWRETNNPALSWVKERLVQEPGSCVSLTAAYADYRNWSKDNGHRETAANHFSRLVKKVLKHEATGKYGNINFVGVELKPYEMEK